MDLKAIAETAGVLGKAKELVDKITHKDEIRVLEGELADKNQQLDAAKLAPEPFGLSSEELAIIGIAVVAIVAIVTIAVVVTKCQPIISAA